MIIEVQRGSYTGEDDIVRLEDDYGRNEQLATHANSRSWFHSVVRPRAAGCDERPISRLA